MPSKAELRQKWNEAGENVVVLHQFQRAKTRPNGSPFPIKFETYLRMAGIEYVNDFDQAMSTKGKSPWMTFNKEDMADSQLCMEHLADELDKDLSKDFTKEEKVLVRSLRIMIEEHFYFCLSTIGFVYNKGKYTKTVMPPMPVPGFLQNLVFGQMVKGLQRQCQAQGIGRHTREEVERLGVADLQTLSDALGDKPYMMGNEPCELDCVVFGFMCMVLHGDPNEEDNAFKKAVEEDFTNLKDLTERIKERYWADWDDCLYKPPPPPVKKSKKAADAKEDGEGAEEEKKEGEGEDGDGEKKEGEGEKEKEGEEKKEAQAQES